MKVKALVCTLLFVGSVFAFSGTIPPTCDAHADYGCAIWNELDGVPNRLDCADAQPGIMPWVTKPVHTDLYSLRTGDGDPNEDPTVYIPGEMMLIHVRTLDIDAKYRGILLYAVDDAGERVGEWSVLEADKYFWAPWQEAEGDPCQQTVLHNTAALKPFHTFFRFTGPPAGTGDVTFVALIKTGDANTGEFWFPNAGGELTISEGVSTKEETDLLWVVSALGESCNEACEAEGRLCESALMESIDSPLAFATEITPALPCAYPILSGCDDFTPSTGSDQYCYFKDAECNAEGRPTSPTECTASSSDPEVGNLFCACSWLPVPSSEGSGSSSDGSSTGSSNGSDSASDGPTPTEPGESVGNGASPLAPLFALLALLSCGQGGRRVSLSLLALCIVLSLSPVQGHNWVNSFSRVPFASTILPCQARRSSSPHIQVARDQYFQVEWASGHGENSYFILIRAEDADKMVEHHYSRLDAYLERSKAAGNDFSQDLAHRKYHRSKDETASPVFVDGVNTGEYDSIVLETDVDFLPRPVEFEGRWTGPGVLWRYSDEDLANDIVSVGFQDEEMPWILGVWRFFIAYHRAGDSDVAQFWIPQGLGLPEGEYTLQYFWRGYGDCIDISYLDQELPVEFPYGRIPEDGGVLYKRIDHCFFPDVQKSYAPPLQFYTDDIRVCITRCVKRSGCNGVNVFPAKLASSVYPGFRQADNIFFQQMNASLYPGRIDTQSPELQEEYEEESAKQELRDAWAAADGSMMLCLPVMAREATTTQDKFFTTDDPEDPRFYSTCYQFELKVDFIGYNISQADFAIEEGPWRFNDQCIDCEQRVLNYRDRTHPIWSISDKCINCDREPAEPEPLFTPNWTWGMSKLRNKEANCQPSTCEEHQDDTNWCMKKMLGLGWGDNYHFGDYALESDCSVLARNDPECSNLVEVRKDINPTGSGVCYCYRSDSCCTGCASRQAGTLKDYVLWEVDPTPADPQCQTGFPSQDGTACCSGTCTECANDAFVAGIGVCCATCINEERFCDEVGPPCMMRGA